MAEKLNLLNPNAPAIADDGYDSLQAHENSIVHYIIGDEVFTESEFEQLKRQQYIKSPPEGFTSDEISSMSDNMILDIDYFLHE